MMLSYDTWIMYAFLLNIIVGISIDVLYVICWLKALLELL